MTLSSSQDILRLSHGNFIVGYLKSFSHLIMALRFLRWPVQYVTVIRGLPWGDWTIVQISHGHLNVIWRLLQDIVGHSCDMYAQAALTSSVWSPQASPSYVTAVVGTSKFRNHAARLCKQNYCAVFPAMWLHFKHADNLSSSLVSCADKIA